MGEGGWDLQAVVSSCTRPSPKEEISSSLSPSLSETPLSLSSIAEPSPYLHELEELCKPFLPKSPVGPISIPIGPSSPGPGPSLSRPAVLPQSPPSKRRRGQLKKVVCHVSADKISSDLWAWRKYGQKPIKGSPFPRGYYKCSSSKGCPARKQVERSTLDPSIFIITYTAEHSHPIPAHRPNTFTSLSSNASQRATSPPHFSSEDEAPKDGAAFGLPATWQATTPTSSSDR